MLVVVCGSNPDTLTGGRAQAHQGVQASSRPTLRCVPAGQMLQVVEAASYSYPAPQQAQQQTVLSTPQGR